MTKFEVRLAQEPTESGSVIIEAENSDDAELKAMTDDLPDTFRFELDDGNDYSASRYVAWCEPYVEPEKVPLVEPTPFSRAERMSPLVKAHVDACNGTENDEATQVGDFLADLMHYCWVEDIDFRAMFERATDHFNEELLEHQELEDAKEAQQ